MHADEQQPIMKSLQGFQMLGSMEFLVHLEAGLLIELRRHAITLHLIAPPRQRNMEHTDDIFFGT